MPESLAEQIIAEKISEWAQKQKERKEQEKREAIRIHPFLTISRDFGCGEEEIIPALEKTLRWKVYGRTLLDHLAERETLSRRFIETLDEQDQNFLDNWINFLTRSGGVLQKDYVLKISRMIKVIAAQESAIILGRGAHLILREKKEGLKIKLTAPLAHRIQNIAKLRNIPPDEAETLVRQKDKERELFIQNNFRVDLQNDAEFDLIFNTMALATGMICKIIDLIFNEKKHAG
ncbi:MAG: AAA family ATPase [Nitrospinales bacterium]